jgi:hypothetical protein
MRIIVLSSFVLPSYSTMTLYFRNLLVASILLFSGSVLCLAGDKWTDSSGTRTVEADFVKLEGIQLTLKSSDGKEIVIPLYKLDSNSRLLARKLAKSHRTPATTDSKTTEPESVATQSAATPESSAPMSSRYSSDQLRAMDQLKANSPHAAFAQFTDGTNETLLAGTVSEGRSVPWTKPDDIRLDDTFLSKENSFVEGSFMFADGSIHYIHIEDDLDPVKFRALFTINGGEPHTFANLYPQGKKFASPRFEIRQSQARMKVSNSLKDIALALLNYHVAYKHLPPAIVYGPDGKPWHSWRVLILPFLGGDEAKLYLDYDQGVPWDDPKNASILKRMPQVYRHPLSKDAEETRTRYLVISGPGTGFPVNATK